MGKLNIAHHKSYHPYRRDNIERVRQDEEEARVKEASEEGRVMLADAEARIERLRQRAGIGGSDSKKKSSGSSSSRRQEEREETRLRREDESARHINFFQDLEQGRSLSSVVATAATDKGVPLAPSKADLRRWYSSRRDGDHSKDEDDADGKRRREAARKNTYDPLTSINQHLASSSHTQDRFKQPRYHPPSNNKPPPDVQARLARESSERERALALVRRKRREMGSETPTTVHGGGHDERGYGDMFNRKEVEEARRRRERRDWPSSSRRTNV